LPPLDGTKTREAAAASGAEYRRIALNPRLRAEREPVPSVRTLLAASAEKREFLAAVTASPLSGLAIDG
jgi:hypothetical protein